MSNEVERWLEHIATDEAQLKRLRQKVREIDEQDKRELRQQDGDEAILREGSETSWRELEERKVREKQDIEDLAGTVQDRADMVEGSRQLWEHNKEVLESEGLWDEKAERAMRASGVIQEGGSRKTFILESVKSLEWLEGEGNDSYKFSGVAFEADAESENGKFYPREVCQKAVDEANAHIDQLTIEMGHPKDDNETSPERIVGGFSRWDLNDNDEVTFKAEFNNTRLGNDARELAKSRLGEQALSIRAGGDLTNETAPDGHKRKRVTDMQLLGLDLVKAGGFRKAKITNIGESKAKEDMIMVGPGLWLPEELAENGTDDEILEYLEENHIKLV